MAPRQRIEAIEDVHSDEIADAANRVKKYAGDYYERRCEEEGAQITWEQPPIGHLIDVADIPWINQNIGAGLDRLKLKHDIGGEYPSFANNLRAAKRYADIVEAEPDKRHFYMFCGLSSRQLSDNLYDNTPYPHSIASNLMHMVQSPPYESIARHEVYEGMVENPTLAQQMLENRALVNIIGHHWEHNTEQAQNVPIFSQETIAKDTYGTLGRSLLLDGLIGARPENLIEQSSESTLSKLINTDVAATLFHFARGFKAEVHSYGFRGDTAVTYDMLDDLLRNSPDPEALILQYCDQNMLQRARELVYQTAGDTTPLIYDPRRGSVQFQLAHHQNKVLHSMLDRVRADIPLVRVLDQLIGRDAISPGLYLQATEFAKGFDDEATLLQAFSAKLDDTRNFIQANPSISEIQARTQDGGLEFQLLKFAVGWAPNKHSIGSEATLVSTIESLAALSPESQRSRYLGSAVFELARVAPPEHVVTEDMLVRCQALINACEMTDNPLFFDQFKDRILELASHAERQYQKKSSAGENPKALAHIQHNYDTLMELAERELTILGQDVRGIADLHRYKELRPYLTGILLKDIGGARDSLQRFIGSDADPNYASRLVEFFEHNITDHYVNPRSNPLNQADAKAIRGLLSLKALYPAFKTARTGESVHIEFMPVRGFLLEASGYIADACWSDKELITETRPHIDGVIITERKPDGRANFAGASLLMRTQSPQNPARLVVRGLNPSDALLNKVDAGELFDTFMHWVGELALADDRQSAVIIDGHTGMAGTNRPRLFAAMRQARATMKHTPHKAKYDTSFNRYVSNRHIYSPKQH